LIPCGGGNSSLSSAAVFSYRDGMSTAVPLDLEELRRVQPKDDDKKE
jgi:hypothetical protein